MKNEDAAKAIQTLEEERKTLLEKGWKQLAEQVALKIGRIQRKLAKGGK